VYSSKHQSPNFSFASQKSAAFGKKKQARLRIAIVDALKRSASKK
jgi:hypothetical protein